MRVVVLPIDFSTSVRLTRTLRVAMQIDADQDASTYFQNPAMAQAFKQSVADLLTTKMNVPVTTKNIPEISIQVLSAAPTSCLSFIMIMFVTWRQSESRIYNFRGFGFGFRFMYDKPMS